MLHFLTVSSRTTYIPETFRLMLMISPNTSTERLGGTFKYFNVRKTAVLLVCILTVRKVVTTMYGFIERNEQQSTEIFVSRHGGFRWPDQQMRFLELKNW